MSRSSELTHLFRAMKAPAAARALPKLAERAREEEWSYERFAEALLSTEISSRESSGGAAADPRRPVPRPQDARGVRLHLPAHVKKQVIEHLGQLDFLHAKENVILLGPPGTGKTHLAIALGDPRLPRRPARPVQHRDRMGRAARRRATPRHASTTSSNASSASRCWSATRSATSRSTRKPRT